MNARILRRAATGLAAWGLLAGGGLLWAADPITNQPVGVAAPATQIADVALAPGGMLYGLVVDGSGVGSADVVVTVRQQDRVIAEAITGPEGKFVMAGLPGGVFQITTSSSQAMFRLWAPGTSPPGARPAALVVHDMQVVRGQSRLGRLLSRPIVIAGLVATAVAVPVAIHQIEIHRGSGS